MDDDMEDSAGVEDKDGGSNRSMQSSCGQPICVFLLTCKVLARLIGASQNGLRLGHIADDQQHFYAWRPLLAANPASSSPKWRRTSVPPELLAAESLKVAPQHVGDLLEKSQLRVCSYRSEESVAVHFQRLPSAARLWMWPTTFFLPVAGRCQLLPGFFLRFQFGRIRPGWCRCCVQSLAYGGRLHPRTTPPDLRQDFKRQTLVSSDHRIHPAGRCYVCLVQPSLWRSLWTFAHFHPPRPEVDGFKVNCITCSILNRPHFVFVITGGLFGIIPDTNPALYLGRHSSTLAKQFIRL